jgi:uncharacterized protein YdbL (DUF1318 family)
MAIHTAPTTRRNVLGFIAAALICAVGLTMIPTTAYALDLDEARTMGFIGERPDGLVGAVQPGAPAEVTALVETVNRARMESYRDVAAKNKSDLQAVQTIAGGKQIERARSSGWFVMDTSGAWRKP